ncbi:fungal-specific transcription factor domain-containing protein [Xylariomycetidae sp. FL0641]|nr:fungal-specific transcription factor domain-containing protein [Xylariomycetidae sp. FL0641]
MESQATVGATSPSKPAIQPQGKPLSCTSCRARKLRCDRRTPCGNCVRSRSECILPTRKRIQRPRQTKNSELLQRLNRLESLVGQVGLAKLEAQGAASGKNQISLPSDEPANEPNVHPEPIEVPTDSPEATEKEEATARDKDAAASRYMSGEFWSSLCDEVVGLKQTLEQSTDSEDENSEEATPESAGDWSSNAGGNPGQLLGSTAGSSSVSDRLRQLPPQHIRYLTATYFQNVDMLLKILHKPTVSAALERLAAHPETASQVTPENEALYHAIYYAAVASLSPEACQRDLGVGRAALAARLQANVEQALARADYLNSSSLETLQALTIYVACLRSHGGSRSSWALLGLAIRLAQALDLHRDGDGARLLLAGKGCSAFEVALRRRLWWQLVVLDIRAAEDRGTTTVLSRDDYDTALPHNLDDAAFGPATTSAQLAQLAKPPGAPSDVTFLLASAQASDVFLYFQHGAERAEQSEADTVRHAQQLEAQFVAPADPAHVASYLASVTVRLIILKLWLTLQYPIHAPRASVAAAGPASPPPATAQELPGSARPRGRLSTFGASTMPSPRRAPASRASALRTAVSIMEMFEAIGQGPFGDRFRWWCVTYVQWHPLAVALAELCNLYKPQAPPPGGEAERKKRSSSGEQKEEEEEEETDAPTAADAARAWAVIERVLPYWGEIIADSRRGSLWRPIRKLYKKAKAARDAAAAAAGAAATPPPDPSATGVSFDSPPPAFSSGFAASGPPAMGQTNQPVTAEGMAGVDMAMGGMPFASTSTMGAVPGGGYGMDAAFGQQQQTSIMPNLAGLDLDASVGPMAHNWMPLPDINFDLTNFNTTPMNPSAMGDTMDWSTWDEFVLDTYAENGSKSGSSEG